MNPSHFDQVMHLIDEDLLLEAAAPVRKKLQRPILAAAACLCLLLGAALWFTDRKSTDSPSLRLPHSARLLSEQLIESDPAMPVLETAFELDDRQYICRLASAAEPADLSGSANCTVSTLSWDTAGVSYVYVQSDAAASVSWYTHETGQQWYLTCEDPIALLTTAEVLSQELGYSMAMAPAAAEEVSFRAVLEDGFLIGETRFTMNGIRYTYRMASTAELGSDFPDISGLSLSGEQQDTQVLWCPARLTAAADGRGKLVWFDVVPGLLYSLTMDQGATGQALAEMAQTIFRPAQEPGF